MGVSRGQDQPTVKLAQGEGLLATLAQKAVGAVLNKTQDVDFSEEGGRQIDARDLNMVDQVTQPGYIVMAADPGIASHWLTEGSGATPLVNQVHSALNPDVGRPWVL